jgi:membrane fusion protein
MGTEDLDGSTSRKASLFRPEAVAEQHDRWLGTVLVAPRASHTLITAIVAFAVLGIAALLFFGEYTHRSRVSGWLVPEQGLVQIVAPQSGVLTHVRAEEGMRVTAGAPLAVLSAELRSEAFGATQDEIVRQLRTRRDSLRAARDRQQELSRHEVAALNQRLSIMEVEKRNLEAEAKLQRDRLALSERESERQRGLLARGIATHPDVQRAEADLLDQALALQTLERQNDNLSRERSDIISTIGTAPMREAMLIAEIDRNIAELEQQLAEVEAQRELVVTAPRDGIVTSLQSISGSSVTSQGLLMTMVPEGSVLQARLYAPSRAIGFVRPGQKVLLRYQAFPYQKFGQYAGTVRNISSTSVGPAEFAGREASAAALISGDSVYRIVVDLDAQSVSAYGAKVPLQPGMQLEADVLIETRRLYEWVLDPLYSLAGRGQA